MTRDPAVEHILQAIEILKTYNAHQKSKDQDAMSPEARLANGICKLASDNPETQAEITHAVKELVKEAFMLGSAGFICDKCGGSGRLN